MGFLARLFGKQQRCDKCGTTRETLRRTYAETLRRAKSSMPGNNNIFIMQDDDRMHHCNKCNKLFCVHCLRSGECPECGDEIWTPSD